MYKIDEASLELVVTMSENHPLGAIAVESGKKTSVDVTQWENWMLQLKTFLTHQVPFPVHSPPPPFYHVVVSQLIIVFYLLEWIASGRIVVVETKC